MPDALAASWEAASPQRRALIAVMALVVTATLLLLAAAPLTAAIGREAAGVARARALLETERVRLNENAALARAPAPPRAGDVHVAVQRVLSRHGLRAAAVPSATTPGRDAVVVDDAQLDALVAALDALMRDEGIRLVTATLTARVEPGRVRADLLLGR
ncbi:MAG: type II secretion system protein GspM [Betaproteobacteria bacterium]